MTWSSVLRGFEFFLLAYFAVLALFYALSALLGLRAIVVYSRELSMLALKDLVDHKYYKPVSILVPAYNEEEGIVSNVHSLLSLRHPEFEVIVAVDGATDRTLERLAAGFGLHRTPQVYRRSVTTEPVRQVFRSAQFANLIVVDKENGGRADAINAALNLASFPLVCVVDADSLLNAEAIARASRLFVEDETVIGVGGSLRPLNGAVVEDGAVVELGAPRNWVERVQVLEYARAFFMSRAAWSRANCLLLISGAFGLFRRDAVIQAGGWERGFVADDMEMVIKLHRCFRELGQHYRIVFTPDPLCWTEVPSRYRDLRLQRGMWERGEIEVLWRHRRMIFNPRYGRVGMVGIPYLWLFEVAAAPIEVIGVVYIVLSAVFGALNVPFAIAFFALAILYGILLSEMGMGIESMLFARYGRVRDRLLLFVAAAVEYLGFRQAIVFTRAMAPFLVRRRRGRYWTQSTPPKSKRSDDASSAREVEDARS